VAEAQVKDEEKQRVFGVIPNFYVSYDPHPLPLTAKTEYTSLPGRRAVDPVSFAIIGGIAGDTASAKYFQRIRQGAARLC